MDFLNSILIISGFLEIVLGFLVYLRNRSSQVNASFAFLNVSLGSWSLGMAFFRVFDDPRLALIFAKDIYISGVLIASSLLYFANVFPNAINFTLKKKLLIFVPTLFHVLVLSMPGYLTREIVYRDWGKEVLLGRFEYLVYSIYFVSFFYIAIYILWHKYRASYGYRRNQISLMLLSMFAASIAGVIFDLILPWFGIYRYIYYGPPFIFLIFWFNIYSIVKHKLLDIRLIIARSIAYALLIVWSACIFIITILLITRNLLIEQFSSGQLIVITVLALFVGFTFQPLKGLLEKVTDEIFFRSKYKPNDLLFSLTKIMASTYNFEDLVRRTLQKLLMEIHIAKGAVAVYNRKNVENMYDESYEKKPDYRREDLDKLFKLRRLVVFEEEQDEEVKQLMRDMGVSVSLPLFESDGQRSLLILGEKKSGDIYSQDDIQVLEIFGSEMSVAMQNARSYEEIRKFNVTLTEEVNKATKDLKEANEHLKELDRLKDDFVSVASHELRTPMTAIKSYIWMALAGQGGPLTEKQKYYLERSYNSVDRLIKLVNDMLNISRIDSGRLSLQFRKIDIDRLARDVMEEIEPRANELGISIGIEQSKSVSEVMADPDKIKEVVYNLLGNALKFTKREGKITVSITEKDNMVQVSVVDTGSGIAEEDMPKLFQKFGILPGTYVTNQRAFGTGLGLYLCRSLIEMHGGRIWAFSEGRGKGASFSFSLKVFNQEELDKFNDKYKDTVSSGVGLVHSQLA